MRIMCSSEAPNKPRACTYKSVVARPNEMQQYSGRFKNGEKTDRYTGSFAGFTDNYGALYCKVHTLR